MEFKLKMESRLASFLLKQPDNKRLIIFDTETTGLKPEKDYICQFSAILYDISDGKLEQMDSLDLYINVPITMDEKVVDIHGITNSFLSDYPFEEDQIEKINAFMMRADVISGYNVEFDISMLKAMHHRLGMEFGGIPYFDICKMARELIPYRELKQKKLGKVAEYFGIEAKFHSSIEDVAATGRVLELFLDMLEDEPTEGTADCQVTKCNYWSRSYTLRRFYISVFIPNKLTGGIRGRVVFDPLNLTFADDKDMDILRYLHIPNLYKKANEFFLKEEGVEMLKYKAA